MNDMMEISGDFNVYRIGWHKYTYPYISYKIQIKKPIKKWRWFKIVDGYKWVTIFDESINEVLIEHINGMQPGMLHEHYSYIIDNFESDMVRAVYLPNEKSDKY